MPATFEIRAAEAGDVVAITELLSELNRDEGYAVIAEVDAVAKALFAPVREVNLSALVACKGPNIIGVMLYYPGYDTLSASVGYHLADMVVTMTERKQHIGSALMKALAEQTLSEKKEWVSLTTLQANAVARSFYQSLGMTQVDVDFFAIGKTALTTLQG